MSTVKWVIDPMHSEIHFKVRHLVISTVTGAFNDFEGTVETAGDTLVGAKIHFTAKTQSVDTGNPQRDGHLVSPDFFDAATYPTLEFVSTSVTQGDDDDFNVAGNFTLHGVAKPITLSGKRAGSQPMMLLKLLGLVMSNADLGEIEPTFKQEPQLSYNLLRLVNSVALGRPQKIATLKQAIVVLGRRQLQRWLQLLPFLKNPFNNRVYFFC